MWDQKDPDHTTDRWKEWKERHDEVCSLNHAGSSRAMEPDIAEVLWGRSQEKNNLRYTVFVGDGDGASFGRVAAAQPYGKEPEDRVTKEDCVGHIQKRMGTKLREVKRTWQGRKLTDGKGIGGKQRLTNARINSYQVYYGKAIRGNLGNVEAAGNAVLAIFYHSVSTDANPQHHMCPDTPTSWCAFHQSRRCKKPFSHKPALPEAVAELVKPVFETLGGKSLLSRCMKGLTQNQNECAHSTLWNIAPKHIFQNPQVIFFAGALATGLFNDGHVFLGKVLNRLGYAPGKFTIKAMETADKERVRKAKLQAKLETKAKRKARRNKKHHKEDAAVQKEGVLYQPGGFGPDGKLIQMASSDPGSTKKTRKCKKCHQPYKGHKRGQPCPTLETIAT